MKVENKGSFFGRLRDRLAPSELTRIRGAYMLSKFGSRWQKRKTGQRYFEHARRTALILMDECNIYDPNLIITALLHDMVEDSFDIDPTVIELFFGPDVCRNVLLLSKINKESYISKLYAAPEHVVLIKACDRLDNLRSLPGCEAEFIERQAKETREKILPLFKQKLNNNVIISKIETELEKYQ
jgi:GTP diphosphokinase / guanosine-3',5'-bis(diphosphate) 3'-diphosphatase